MATDYGDLIWKDSQIEPGPPLLGGCATMAGSTPQASEDSARLMHSLCDGVSQVQTVPRAHTGGMGMVKIAWHRDVTLFAHWALGPTAG